MREIKSLQATDFSKAFNILYRLNSVARSMISQKSDDENPYRLLDEIDACFEILMDENDEFHAFRQQLRRIGLIFPDRLRNLEQAFIEE